MQDEHALMQRLVTQGPYVTSFLFIALSYVSYSWVKWYKLSLFLLSILSLGLYIRYSTPSKRYIVQRDTTMKKKETKESKTSDERLLLLLLLFFVYNYSLLFRSFQPYSTISLPFISFSIFFFFFFLCPVNFYSIEVNRVKMLSSAVLRPV